VKAAVREAIKEAIKTHPDYAVERIVGLVFEATPALVRETAKEIGHSWPKRRKGYTVRATAGETATANLEDLNFKVPKSFRKRFRTALTKPISSTINYCLRPLMHGKPCVEFRCYPIRLCSFAERGEKVRCRPTGPTR
jgi:hypothetical protein